MQGLPARVPLLVWLGGGAFLSSLGLFLYSYFVAFGRPAAPGPRWPAIAIDVALFTVFALHHSVLARTGVKRRLTRHVPAVYERSLYVWVSSLLFAAVCLGWRDVPGVLYSQAGPVAALHWAVVLAGVWLTARATGVLDPLDLAGIRQAAGGAATSTFRVVGPYCRVRHPIYLGWALVVFGVPHMTATRMLFAVVSTLYLLAAIPFEERSLVETFGDTYREYQRRVRWRLIPGIW